MEPLSVRSGTIMSTASAANRSTMTLSVKFSWK